MIFIILKHMTGYLYVLKKVFFEFPYTFNLTELKKNENNY